MKEFSVSPLRMELHEHAYALPCEGAWGYGTKYGTKACQQAKHTRLFERASEWDSWAEPTVTDLALAGSLVPGEDYWVSTRTSVNLRKSWSNVATGVLSAADVAAIKQSTKWNLVLRKRLSASR